MLPSRLVYDRERAALSITSRGPYRGGLVGSWKCYHFQNWLREEMGLQCPGGCSLRLHTSKMTLRQDDPVSPPSLDSVVLLSQKHGRCGIHHRLPGKQIGAPVRVPAVQGKVSTYLPTCCLHPLLHYEPLSVQPGRDQVALGEVVLLFHLQTRDKQIPLD